MLRTVSGKATVVLGVDIGTTSAKAVAFDGDGGAPARGETGYPLLEPEPGEAVQDPARGRRAVARPRARGAGARDRRARSPASRSAPRCTRCRARRRRRGRSRR